MNKITVITGALVLLAGGYFFGSSDKQEPTVIKMTQEPKAEFTSEGSEEGRYAVLVMASAAATDPDSDPSPNRPRILNNSMRDNGKNPSPAVPARFMEDMDKGRLAYYGVFAGCQAYSSRMIGPPTQIIQSLYMDDPKGSAECAAKPVRKRQDYPEMPPRGHLDQETLLAAADFMPGVEK